MNELELSFARERIRDARGAVTLLRKALFRAYLDDPNIAQLCNTDRHGTLEDIFEVLEYIENHLRIAETREDLE